VDVRRSPPDYAALHARARERGVDPLVYWLARAVVQPFCHLYFRMSRIGREHVPDGPVILASNHRSFLDPFVIGTVARRPIYYVAKKELFANRLVGWFLASLGAFPVDRGTSDGEMLETVRAILARGDALLMFPEGTRIRPGPLGRPKRGIGRLALETGAPVVPVAILGTEAVRRGWRIRPHKVRLRIGRPLTFPRVESASRELAAAVTDRIWPCVMLQWEWLGGLPPLRRAAVVGDGPWAGALADVLARAGLEVERAAPEGRLRLSGHDLVCLAVPAAVLPAALERHGPAITETTGVLVASHGLVPRSERPPAEYVAQRTRAWAVGALGGGGPSPEAPLVLASPQPAFARQLADAFAGARVRTRTTTDVHGVELEAPAPETAVPAQPVGAA
jgi:glycerol-3-phosphate dehydrogenase (NAD(P)+)